MFTADLCGSSAAQDENEKKQYILVFDDISKLEYIRSI
jgi:hypothetical protein